MFYYTVYVYPPKKSGSNESVALHFEIQKMSLKNIADGQDEFMVEGPGKYDPAEIIDGNIEKISKNYTPPLAKYGHSRTVKLRRKVALKDVRKLKLSQMPGFKVTWYYSGSTEKPALGWSYDRYDKRKAFVRNGSNGPCPSSLDIKEND